MANENHRDGQGGGNGGSFLQHFYFFLTSVLKWRVRERNWFFIRFLFREREKKRLEHETALPSGGIRCGPLRH